MPRYGAAFVIVCVLAALGSAPLPSSARDLVEPSEKELRGAYLDFLHDFVASQGEFVDPACALDGAGCTVRLLDVRRTYRLVSFKKIACQPAEAAGFVCRFDVKVACAWTSNVPADPAVADLYCEPVFNKVSSLVARVSYSGDGWVIARFLQG